MAKEKDEAVVVEVDYVSMSLDELQQAIGKAWEDKDMRLMGQLSKLFTKAEAQEAKDKKESLLAELVEFTKNVRLKLKAVVQEMVDAGEIPAGAEGIWYAQDFGEVEEVGINPSCRLVKSGKKASTGEGTATSSYKAGLPPTKEMLDRVGSEVYFEEDTTVTIDGKEEIMPAGTTYQEAYNFSTNGGWRNRVRMAVGKADGKL